MKILKASLKSLAFLYFKATGNAITLFMACMTGNAQDVLAALACGAQINARNALGNTPLGVAVRYNRVDIIEILLLKVLHHQVLVIITDFL